MLQIISGFWISRAVYVIAKLGIPDLLKSGPKTAEELASATDTHAPSLFRILRALVRVGGPAQTGLMAPRHGKGVPQADAVVTRAGNQGGAVGAEG